MVNTRRIEYSIGRRLLRKQSADATRGLPYCGTPTIGGLSSLNGNILVRRYQNSASFMRGIPYRGTPSAGFVRYDWKRKLPLRINVPNNEKRRRSTRTNGNGNISALRKRTVVGSDTLVFIRDGTVHVEEIYNAMTYKELFARYPAQHHFVRNKNVHHMPDQLRGVLTYARNKIWIVVKSVGEKAFAEMLFPNNTDETYVELDLFEYGFYLQQITGELVGRWKDTFRPAPEKSYSLSDTIEMSPEGPDCLYSSLPRITIPVVPGIKFYREENNRRRKRRRRNLGSKSVEAVVYVLDNQERFHHTKNTFMIPTGRKLAKTSRYAVQSFVQVSRECLITLLQMPQPITPTDMDHFLYKNRLGDVVELVIPSLVDNKLRIKVVSPLVFESLRQQMGDCSYVSNGSNQFLFGSEATELTETPGTLVSSWSISPLVSQPALTYRYAKSLVRVHGNGYGKRARSDCVGLNLYCSRRESSRPHPSPLVSDNCIKDHQYWRQSQKYPLIQPVLEKRIHFLTTNANQLSRQLNPPMYDMLGNCCNKQIVTTGRIPCNAQFTTVAFVNTGHVDSCDGLLRSQQGHLGRSIDTSDDGDATKEYKRRLLEFKGFCVPTTCAYQFVHGGQDVESRRVEQYFSLEGMGLAVEIQHGIGHHFLGGAFSHRTCLCLVFDINGNIQLSNAKDDLLVVAWGKSGGSPDYKRFFRIT